jgi:crotonobetainyl-CoA:carnitine CoA-transferase CaiB-like acyl-CoA transferase
MARWCEGRTTEAAIAELGAARIPAGPVLAPSEVLTHPQIVASGLIEPMHYPGIPAPAPVIGAPIRLSGTPREPMLRAPQAGEHSAAILTEAGFSVDEIAAMASAGVIHLGG